MSYPDNASADSVAADQLRAIVERIERPADRLDYVLHRLNYCRGISPQAMNRAFWLASRVLSVDFETCRRIVRLAWLADASGMMDVIGPLSPRIPGFVYLAKLEGQHDRVKIGFTTDPGKRARALSSNYGRPVHIFETFAGTMLDEHVAHCDRRAARLEGEWFRTRVAA
jgi:hypothetical protein